jgi:prepilin-type N-terminal cleavage/methylation domain-containing protein
MHCYNWFFNLKKRKSRILNSGFTIVEVLVVAAVVSLVAFLAIPEFMQSRIRAAGLAETENLRTIEAAKRAFEVANPGRKLTTIGDLLPYLPGGRVPSSVHLPSGAALLGAQIHPSAMSTWSTKVLTKIGEANFKNYGSDLSSYSQMSSTSYTYQWVNDGLLDLGLNPLSDHILDPSTGQGYLNVLVLDQPTLSTFNGEPSKEPRGGGADALNNGFNDLSTPGKIYIEAPRSNS